MYTLHSWIGLTAAVLFGLQVQLRLIYIRVVMTFETKQKERFITSSLPWQLAINICNFLNEQLSYSLHFNLCIFLTFEQFSLFLILNYIFNNLQDKNSFAY